MNDMADINIHVLIMAAGGSTRFKGIKQIASLSPSQRLNEVTNDSPKSNESLLTQAYFKHMRAGFNQVSVVLGANAELVQTYLPKNTNCILAKDWHLGLGHSIACAVKQIPEGLSHLCIALADQAALKPSHFTAMIAQAKAHPDCVIAARYGANKSNQPGNNLKDASPALGVPCIFPKKYFAQLLKLEGDKGARDLLRHLQSAHPSSIIGVDMPEASVDIDTQADLHRFLQGAK
jgi:CTP:molybdopterin cytidylyltransferase MocA